MVSNELTLIIQDEKRVRAVRSGSQEEDSGLMEFDDLRLATISIFEDWLRRGAISRREELEVLGTHLYKGLFTPVETFFNQALRRARETKQRLCVRLQFQKPAEDLSSLPWEYLYCPDKEGSRGFFLATDVNLMLARYMPLTDLDSSDALEPDQGMLRILIVESEPTGLGPVSATAVIEAIEKLAEKSPIKILYLSKPTVDNFRETLENIQPHVLHFIGHGRYRLKEKRGEIALLKPDEKSVEWCPDRTFAEYFQVLRSRPRIVFLHLCEGALQQDEGVLSDSGTFISNFAVLAPQLILASIQAVVAMQHPIANQAAIPFCRVFYKSLAEGKPVDDAVQAGRWQIAAFDSASRVFGTPVLYMHSSDGIIQPITNERKLSI